MAPIRKGTIVRMQGSWGSGLGELIIDEIIKGEEKRVSIDCENASTVRALDGCFGDVISSGHSFDNAAIEGKEIFFSADDFGILEGFTPVNDAPPEMVRIYEGAIP